MTSSSCSGAPYQTDEVHATPLLASPPWINKYYVMDLAPGRSLIEWAVQHGRTVFAIGYRNPDSSLSGLTMDDYLVHGTQAALDVVTEITRSDRVDIVAVCLGGALATMNAALLAAGGESAIGTLTLINTLLDYAEPGQLGVFVDEGTVRKLERRVAKKGYLDGADMAGTFNALRANELIFSYVASNWLMGEQPPAFDLLAWNADSTRLPAAMCSFYLRSCYLENQLAAGAMELAGRRLDLAAVMSDTYIVAAERDRIVPWDVVLQVDRAPRRPRALRAHQRRAHRRHRQPTQPQVVGADLRHQSAGCPAMARRRNAAGRVLE